MTNKCADCGLPEEFHHEFVPPMEKIAPEGCICDVTDWFPTIIPPACDKFVGVNQNSFCENCEHDKECHGKD